MHDRTEEEIYVKVPSGIKSLETQGSSAWNEEGNKALERGTHLTSW